MIKNIIFDIGNVLADFRWREFLQEKGYDEAIVDRIAKASVLSGQWCEFDRGVWTTEQILEAFAANDPGIKAEIYEAYSDLTGFVTPREYAIPWIKELKERGYKVLYLSNYFKQAEEESPEALRFIPYTDGGILSYKEKLIKPDAAIYELLLERFRIKAQESVFLDDTLVNVEAAERIGIHGIHFTTREEAVQELRKLGVE